MKYFTIDDTIPDNHSSKYDGPVSLPTGVSVTLRILTYRNGTPVSHLITLKP